MSIGQNIHTISSGTVSHTTTYLHNSQFRMNNYVRDIRPLIGEGRGWVGRGGEGRGGEGRGGEGRGGTTEFK